VEFYSTG
jgi:hypothetical protein